MSRVLSVSDETSHVRTLALDVPGWPGHRAGQHVDVRLVAEDGYQAQRSYSIASAPESSSVELTIERLDDGEVSTYLCDVLRPGDGLEVRGPIGGYFVWDGASEGPLMLIGGGSGIVPLMAMLRHRERSTDASLKKRPAKLLYSVRSRDDVIYRDELQQLGGDHDVSVALTLTRSVPADWPGYHRRVDRMMLEEFAWPASEKPDVFVCGPTPFVESVASMLVELGHDASKIRTERFGPTG